MQERCRGYCVGNEGRPNVSGDGESSSCRGEGRARGSIARVGEDVKGDGRKSVTLRVGPRWDVRP